MLNWLDLESSTLGGSTNEAIQALPLQTATIRRFSGSRRGLWRFPDATSLGRNSQNVTSNGAKTTSNNIQFNGIDANNLPQNSAANDGEEGGTAIPAPDAILEFKVQTANYDASYGRSAGANVDLVSKSGTNRFHGSAWEFLRNNIFNANDFFLNMDGQPRPTSEAESVRHVVWRSDPARQIVSFFHRVSRDQTEVNGEAAGAKQTTILPQFTSDCSAAALGAQFCPANHLECRRRSDQRGRNAGGLRRLQHQSGRAGPAQLQAQLTASTPYPIRK